MKNKMHYIMAIISIPFCVLSIMVYTRMEKKILEIYERERKLKNINKAALFWLEGFCSNNYSYEHLGDYERIAIYGAGELGILLEKMLLKAGVEVLYFIDKNVNKTGINVKSPCEKFYDIDLIIVTAINNFEEIEELLKEKTFARIISLTDLLYELEEREFE